MSRSEQLFARASAVIPGGVNSPVRAFKSVDFAYPPFIASAKGPYVFDADAKRYIDYVGSWGPMILGHAHPVVEAAVVDALRSGASFGAPTEREVEFAELLCEKIPHLEMLRLVNSGTEATMTAVRLARGVTGRSIVVKCDGCYHGHADCFLVQAGSGVATLGISGSPGVPDEVAAQTVSIAYNDLQAFEQLIDRIGAEQIAALIIEPVAGNMGLILPKTGYLEGLRSICTKHGIIFILDEVMTGFRVAFGGAAERFSITPDLVTYGKIIGGGLPIAAFGGRRDLMQQLAPSGPVYQAGTLSGNPLAVAAGKAMVDLLLDLDPYESLQRRANRWQAGISKAAQKAGVPLQVSTCGSMLGFYFSKQPVTNFAEAKDCDVALFKRFFSAMLQRGIYLAPSAFEAGFLSDAHSDDIIDQTIAAAEDVLCHHV